MEDMTIHFLAHETLNIIENITQSKWEENTSIEITFDIIASKIALQEQQHKLLTENNTVKRDQMVLR
jgi:hypothetical protein